jgi:hypothetical protein
MYVVKQQPPVRAAIHLFMLLQALGDQMCIILAQSMSPTRQFTASLTVSVWALAKLSWTPTLPQAQVLVRLLAQALTSGEFCTSACLLFAAMLESLPGLSSNLAASLAAAVSQWYVESKIVNAYEEEIPVCCARYCHPCCWHDAYWCFF